MAGDSGVEDGVCGQILNCVEISLSIWQDRRRMCSMTKRRIGCWMAHSPECKESSTALRLVMSSGNADMLCSKNRKLNLMGRKIEKSLFVGIVKEKFYL